jgi:lysine 2,3-aminomutase
MNSPQPYLYSNRELVAADWQRFPGWRSVSEDDWLSPKWQRQNSITTTAQLHSVLGRLLADSFYADLQQDIERYATMSMRVPPHMLNTMAPGETGAGPGGMTEAFLADPVRRYMLPVLSDRLKEWPSHPMATRDSLHEQEMWAVEGLVHRYPTKVLAELAATCPQYCAHCTRMDLVGQSTATVEKLRFKLSPTARTDRMIEYLRAHPGVRDVVVSGGDAASVPWRRLESFIMHLIGLPSIRDIRIASKTLIGIPQYWLSPEILQGLARISKTARARNTRISFHTHANTVQSITPLTARAAQALLDAGISDVRNQGVLLRGVNDSVVQLLDLCFAMLDHASIMPYYFYLCDIIPASEHWRISVAQAQSLQEGIMGYLPGFATPRVICDVPYAGKRWVNQWSDYDLVCGISYWRKNYRTPLESSAADAVDRLYKYLDPVDSLPPEGQEWWRSRVAAPEG